jgi:hypothetical protein
MTCWGNAKILVEVFPFCNAKLFQWQVVASEHAPKDAFLNMWIPFLCKYLGVWSLKLRHI